MKSLKQGLLIAAVVLSQPTWSCTEDGTEGFVPENNMKISVNAKRFGGLTEAQFKNAIERVEVLYAPIVAQQGGHGPGKTHRIVGMVEHIVGHDQIGLARTHGQILGHWFT